VRPQSAKAKGRRLQQAVRDSILAAFPSLEPDDVRSTSMGASGADILLSPVARRLFPFYVEAKNQESINIWKAIAQAEAGRLKGFTLDGPTVYPLVVFKRNNTETYAALPFKFLLELVEQAATDNGRVRG
jgi:hypothetical protein